MNPEGSPPAVQAESLRHFYGPREALAGVTFAVARGEIFGVLGPNGGGKSTLFKILCTLMPPTSGAVRVLGHELGRGAHAVRCRLGVVFQHPSLDEKLTAWENLLLQGHLYGLRGAGLRSRARELLERMGLADRARDLVETLSSGLRRRAELAKGLLHRPELLLLDEPCAGLDPGARKEFDAYLGRLREEEGVTILLTTHFMEEAEGCDRVAILDRGRLVAEGAPDALKESVGGDVVVVHSASPGELREKIRERFGWQAALVDGALRMELPRGHEFVRELVESFPGEVQSVTFGKPTLEDVFFRVTGHRFWGEGPAEGDGS